MFLEHHISILMCFLKDHVTLKIQFCPSQEKITFKGKVQENYI